MMQPKRIVVDLVNDKFRYKGANDLSFLGYRAIRKFEEYTSEVCISNLFELSKAGKAYDWQIDYTPIAQTVRGILLQEFMHILEAKKYKTMLDDEIDIEFEKQKIYEKLSLDNYQKRAILFALHVKRCGLFLDMGLGKTPIGATLVQHLYNNELIKRGSTLIVAPKTLHGEENWEGELEKFSDLTMVNLRDDLDNINNPYADCFIMNADRFRLICLDKDGEYIKGNPLEKKGFECVVFDEATKLKTHNSKIHDCFQTLSKHYK